MPLIPSSGGNVAHDSADSGNPIKVGGVYKASPGVVSDGDRTDILTSNRGALLVNLSFSGAASDGLGGAVADGRSNTVVAPLVLNMPYYKNASATWDSVRGDTNGALVQPGFSAGYWSYTSGVTPILSNTTTAVTIKAAAGASVRNMIDSLQITTTAFGASVPLVIRDGAGGTVLWALTVPTGGFLDPVTIHFPMPLRSTANTLLEVATPTANTSGTVTLSVQGHTGT